MSYEEFLDLPVDYITQYAKHIRSKRENNIPLTEEDVELQEHFVRYTEELKLQEEKARLEHMFSLDAHNK
jgi:hypothetical protein